MTVPHWANALVLFSARVHSNNIIEYRFMYTDRKTHQLGLLQVKMINCIEVACLPVATRTVLLTDPLF